MSTSFAHTAAPTPVSAQAHAPLDRRIVLSGLWVSMLFVFAFVDIFAFWRADVINGALTGTVPQAGFEIGQTFLALITLYILVPSLMVAGSLLLPYRFNRLANLALAGTYALTIVGTMVAETWAYDLIGSGVELVPLAAIVWVALRWR